MICCGYTDPCNIHAQKYLAAALLCALHPVSLQVVLTGTCHVIEEASLNTSDQAAKPALPEHIAIFAGQSRPWATWAEARLPHYCVLCCTLTRPCCPVQEYFLNTSAWADVNPRQMLGPAVCIKEFDLLTVSQQEIAAPVEVRQLFANWTAVFRWG